MWVDYALLTWINSIAFIANTIADIAIILIESISCVLAYLWICLLHIQEHIECFVFIAIIEPEMAPWIEYLLLLSICSSSRIRVCQKGVYRFERLLYSFLCIVRLGLQQ